MVTRRSTLTMAALALAAITSCARAHSPPASAASATLIDPAGGQERALDAITGASRFTVVTFFSAHCPCQQAHDARLRALYEAYAPKGIAFVGVDSEISASPARDVAEARARSYPFPLLIDRGGALARALGAEYATYTVILDARGRTLYRGGIDTDRTHLTDTTAAYLRDALDDLLAAHPVRVPQSEALGCTLQTH
jgi:hypothetical protein